MSSGLHDPLQGDDDVFEPIHDSVVVVEKDRWVGFWRFRYP